MSTPRPRHDRRKGTSRDGSRSVRWRLWAAMLALALVPTMVGIYLTTAQLDARDPGVEAERARATARAAGSLLAAEAAIEARLQVAADDPELARLADGIGGAADRQAATRILRNLRAGDPAVVRGACIVRSGDGKQIPLTGSESGLASCAGEALRRSAALAHPDTVTAAVLDGHDTSSLLLATPMRSVSGRHRGVLSAEVDVAALLDRSRSAGGDVAASMLVDMGAAEVVATAAAAAGPVGGAPSTVSELVGPRLDSLLREEAETSRELRAMGFAPTLVPLWGSDDGTRMGLLQLWPETPGEWPLEVRLALMLLLAGAIVAVILMVRYFLDPFQEMADSKAELQVLYREAREDALADGLTGLGNHRAFQEELGRQIRSHDDTGTPFSLVLMDLDDLKLVNDREGHAAGDQMLVAMARTMRELARDGDRLYRTGGDEFAIVLPGTSVEDAVTVAQRILHFCKRPPGGGRPSPFSCGVSGVPRFTRQRDMVYRQADAALYWAKRNYRGSVEVFEPERDLLPDELTDATANAVAEVITGKLLRPVFQPIVDLRSGRILGFEGLIRPDPHGPLPDTGRLFAAAAAAGRTVDLDLACLEVVVNAASAIGPDRLLTINLSPRTLEVKDFDAAWLLSGLVRNGISPSRVIIELTEREEVDDLGRLQQTFNLLQQYGLRLAADDVGAGNAGLRLLSQVQFDIMKIDLALVQSGAHRHSARVVLESLRDLALSQNARMIAEGVETARQLHVIREMEIGAAQGFLLGRPNASVAQTFVDVRELENGLLVPRNAELVEPPAPAGAVREDQLADLPEERRALFLSPAGPRLGAEPGPA